MKKLMIAVFALMTLSLSAVAQTPAQKGPAAPAQVKKEKKVAPATVAVKQPAAKPSQAAPATAAHAKKDGTPDKRFKENKTAPAVHTKKDGTPDMRYKENKHK